MNAETELPAEFRRAASVTCPHCGTVAQFNHRFTFEVIDEPEMPRRVVGRRTYGGWQQAVYLLGAWSCTVCDMPIIGTADRQGKILTFEPNGSAVPEFADVPDDIRDDAQEAHRCFGAEAYKATVAMARRAIQAACHERGAPDKRLVDQIGWLEEERKITPQMRDMADRVRITGNDGAHPDKDGLKGVDADDASAALVFLDEFLRYLYAIPAALARADAKRARPSQSI